MNDVGLDTRASRVYDHDACRRGVRSPVIFRCLRQMALLQSVATATWWKRPIDVLGGLAVPVTEIPLTISFPSLNDRSHDPSTLYFCCFRECVQPPPLYIANQA